MRRALPWLVGLLGGALVVAGGVALALADRVPADLGWTSYAPLESPTAYRSSVALTFADRTTVLGTGRHLVGAGLVVAGLLVLAGVGGWLLGSRAAQGRSVRG